jgi:2,3-dihydro-2,3-dihydroxybenzoate dehydrogenase
MTEPSADPLDPRSAAGRVALVVGAAGGIGSACVDAFATAGAVVAAADLEAPAVALPGTPHTAHALDVSDPASVERTIAEVVEAHGRLDVVVVVAGTLHVRSALETAVEDWDRVFAVNARGAFLTARGAARAMVAGGHGGRIVCFGSIVAHVARPNNVAYCASKAALLQTVRCLALELAPHGITVNAVSPGSTSTPMLLGVQTSGDADAHRSIVEGDAGAWRLGIPLGRMAEPRDQAAAAVYLASDAARHVTGQELIVDGGQTVV